MKQLIFYAVTIIGCWQTATAGDSLAKMVGQYELDKKEVATAYLATTVLPGAGSFYCGEELQGIGLIAWSASMVLWAKNSDQLAGPIVGLAVGRIVEYALDYSNVRRYNQALRQNIGLAVGANSVSLTVILPI